MKGFLRRLRFFGVGFGIGLVIVIFVLNNRGCSWLPSNRVKNSLLSKIIVMSEDNLSKASEKGLTKKEIIHFLNDGEIHFGESNKKGNPKVYKITKSIKGKEIELWFTHGENDFFTEVLMPKGRILSASHSSSGTGKMLSFPKVKNMVFFEDNVDFEKRRKLLGISNEKQIFSSIKQNGTIDFGKSKFKNADRPMFMVEFTFNKEKILAPTIWFKEKMEMSWLYTKKDNPEMF